MINYNTYYNSKNRVEISINKKKLSKMAKEMGMKSEEMHQLLLKILTPTHQATKKDLLACIMVIGLIGRQLFNRRNKNK